MQKLALIHKASPEKWQYGNVTVFYLASLFTKRWTTVAVKNIEVAEFRIRSMFQGCVGFIQSGFLVQRQGKR